MKVVARGVEEGEGVLKFWAFCDNVTIACPPSIHTLRKKVKSRRLKLDSRFPKNLVLHALLKSVLKY